MVRTLSCYSLQPVTHLTRKTLTNYERIVEPNPMKFKLLLILSSFLLSHPLLAQAPGAQAQGGLMGMLLPMAVVMGIFYFLIIRPQRKKETEHQTFLAALQSGDEVVTQGGMMGKVSGLNDKVVTLEVSPNVKLKILKSSIAGKIDPAQIPGS